VIMHVMGMGDATATCPSDEQLAGIVDMNDPCQSGLSTLPLTTIVPGGLTPAQTSGLVQAQGCIPTGTVGPLAPGEVYCATGTGVNPAVALCPVNQTCTFISGIPDTWIYGLAGAVAVMVLASMVGGGGKH
jgi:hypothetical protein